MLIYGSICWAFRNNHCRKIKVAKIQMRKWKNIHYLKNRNQYKGIKKDLGVADIEEEMNENCLRRLGDATTQY